MTDKLDVSSVRREYRVAGLDRDNLATSPFDQFNNWMEEILAQDRYDATSMTLATADASGYPTARIVLLKDYGEEGFTWFTNYGSEKGHQLAENNRAALLFYWSKLERQVRIKGRVEKVSRELSEAYFQLRPYGSQIGALASSQTEIVDSRESLEQHAAVLQSQYAQGKVPCPENWGGYRLIPEEFEFWQGRESRLHDRFRFRLESNGWQIDRLQP